LRRLCLVLLALPLSAQETPPICTSSGLKADRLAEGKANTAPKPGDRVKVHYTGCLADGTKFDSSLDKGRPLEFVVGVGMVIEGWDEGLPLMDVGSKWKLRVPAALAYGAEGLPRAKIPPGADLVYEIEMVEVEPGKPLPGFRAADAAKQKATASGLKWEELEEGTGATLSASDVVEMRCTIWTTDGKLVFDSTALGAPIAGQVESARFTRTGEKFLAEALLLMKETGKARFEVPPGLCWGETKVLPRLPPNTATVWQIDVLRTIRFQPLDPAKTKKTASGLEYEVIAEGTGATPGPASGVAVHYTGWLENGTEFDSSHRRGQPMTFGLNQVIKGWTEGLQLMKEGSTYRFRISAALAYGERSPTEKIPPNSTLIFEVELLKTDVQVPQRR
jgi:peptidylprolyl isomerase